MRLHFRGSVGFVVGKITSILRWNTVGISLYVNIKSIKTFDSDLTFKSVQFQNLHLAKHKNTLSKYPKMLIQICSVEFPNMVLTNMGHDDHDRIELRLDENLPNQIFKMEEDGDWVVFKLSQHDSKCLDFDHDNHRLQVYRKKIMNDSNQKWKVVEMGEFRMIKSKHDKSDGYVMTVPAAHLGTPMEVRKNIGGGKQKFTIKQIRD